LKGCIPFDGRKWTEDCPISGEESLRLLKKDCSVRFCERFEGEYAVVVQHSTEN